MCYNSSVVKDITTALSDSLDIFQNVHISVRFLEQKVQSKIDIEP